MFRLVRIGSIPSSPMQAELEVIVSNNPHFPCRQHAVACFAPSIGCRRVESKDQVIVKIHQIFLSAGIGSAKQVEAVRALGRAGGPQAAKVIGQIYQEAFSGSAIQMACIAALGEAARTCPSALAVPD